MNSSKDKLEADDVVIKVFAGRSRYMAIDDVKFHIVLDTRDDVDIFHNSLLVIGFS